MECMRDQFKEGVVLDGRYVTVSPLNHGSFGMVSLARDLNTDEMVAVKCLTKPSTFEAEDVSQVEELKYHTLLGTHPNIVNLLHSFETGSHLFIVLEFCSMGDLYEAIRLSKGPLEREHVREFMLQLISAVEHMHSKGVYHRDIKPENIFLTQDGSMKLGDFGLATIDKLSDEASVGSDRYMAPEQYDTSAGAYDPAKADIWAIGICLLNILFARNPFSAPTPKDPLFLDFSFDRQTLFDIFPTMSEDTFEVLNHSLTIDPSKRSLEEMRIAIERAVSWTTDDEIFDDEFCTEDREVVQASSDREPLRTPSIQSPQVANGSSFPWAKALHASPQHRQLSIIPDHESQFSDSEFDVPDRKETVGSLDSGLGASLSSLGHKSSSPFKSVSFFSNSRIEVLPPRPLLFSNSRIEKVPATGSSPVSPIFVSNASVAHIPIVASQKKATNPSVNYGSGISTSWSDWVDEEEEEEEERQRVQDINRRTWSWGSEKASSVKGVLSANKENFFDEDVFGIDKLDEGLDDDVEWVTGGWEAIRR